MPALQAMIVVDKSIVRWVGIFFITDRDADYTFWGTEEMKLTLVMYESIYISFFGGGGYGSWSTTHQ